MAEVNLTVDGVALRIEAGATILQAAAAAGIDIPTICYHEACTANGLCRMCVVEVTGARLLQPSCIAAAGEGMEVTTRSPRVERARRTRGCVHRKTTAKVIFNRPGTWATAHRDSREEDAHPFRGRLPHPRRN
jgi:predicted molibdopterin-dependent oxidoreductase YjgC